MYVGKYAEQIAHCWYLWMCPNSVCFVFMLQVLDTCQKQEAARSSSTVRFSCSTTDVLSCIMHIINKGYIRRNEDNPHIVEFLVEDPSTPQKSQAHFFSKLDLNKSTGSTKADTRCADDPRPLEHGEGKDTQ